MSWFRRITLFLVVNILVVTTISLLLHLFGVRPYITRYGLNYNSLAVFCLIWGMGGALISLGLSRKMAQWMMRVKLIDPETREPELRELVQCVYKLARQVSLPAMPQVGIYNSPEVNAFATGPTKSRALVAVSSGLLQRLERDEIEGVLGHEMSHIANGDMVTMTLLQGIINAFVMFLSRVIAFAITQSGRERGGSRRGGLSYGSYFIVRFVLEITFMILGSIVVSWFSRYREFRADEGGARLAGREKMINALEALRKTCQIVDPRSQPATVQTLKITGRRSGFMRLFASHPPLEERIKRLQFHGHI